VVLLLLLLQMLMVRFCVTIGLLGLQNPKVKEQCSDEIRILREISKVISRYTTADTATIATTTTTTTTNNNNNNNNRPISCESERE
jgi:hypothetical protein